MVLLLDENFLFEQIEPLYHLLKKHVRLHMPSKLPLPTFFARGSSCSPQKIMIYTRAHFKTFYETGPWFSIRGFLRSM